MARRKRAERSERQLAKRLGRRDPEALREAYALYAPTTFGLLLSMLRDRGAAEDVQQQVFLEVWRKAPTYDPRRASLLVWIMTIARSRALDHLRRRVPEPHDPTGNTLVRLAGPAADGEADALVEHWHLAHQLNQLPADEADVLRRRFYGGASQSQIAGDTGIPLGTVKMRMASGLRRLRERLEVDA